jgi:hypothetical protein
MIIEVAEVLKITDKEVWGRTVDGYVSLALFNSRAKGYPQWIHAGALSDISFPHSGHLISAIITSKVFIYKYYFIIIIKN